MKIRRVKYFFMSVAALVMPSVMMYSQEVSDTLRNYSIDKSVVTSKVENRPVRGLMTGNLILDVSDMDWLPQILGTPDILKTMQLMPGVAASGEMDSGVYVRGSDPGQVSVFLDGARIYFPSHLFSFYSVFNSDHISSASMLKSGISPLYGGGTSGVIDVETPESLFSGFGGKLSVGLISSQATISLPLGPKSALRVSGRGTYANYIMNSLSLMSGKAQPQYGFYDTNLTWLCRPDEDNSVKFNAYYSNDDMSIKMGGLSLDGDMDWNNMAASLTWERFCGKGIGMKHTASLSRFSNNIRLYKNDIRVALPSEIMDVNYRGSLSVPFGQSSLNAGVEYVLHRMRVQSPEVSGLYDSVETFSAGPSMTHEFGAAAEYSKWFSFPLKFSLGLRYGGAWGDGFFYSGLEPRVSVSYDFYEGMRLRASAMRQMQYINTVSVSGMGLPTDFLVPADGRIRPQAASTVSLGFSHSFSDGMFEYSVEPYFSALDNVLEFDGIMFDWFGTKYTPQDHILSGTGRNYGVEFMFKKNSGRFNGWISYTLSRSLRKFPGIMDGKVFSSKHDRPHSLSCVLNYRISPQWTCSAVFVYGTGLPFTRPLGVYVVGENLIREYGPHNGGRMPDYNRLDLSVTYELPLKGRCTHSFNVSVYNAYARPNPMMCDIRLDFDKENPDELRLYIGGVRLYTLLPSITYNLAF